MNPSFDEILLRISEVGPSLHSAGTFSPRALDAIAQAARKKPIHNSAETGSGASTLLLSHLSQRHTVFALDGGSGSVVNVRESPLLRPGVVTFVEGPSQLTLPRFEFTEPFQFVLIDGPHGYPFPDLEYFYLYPHLEPGALLILDDIHIPTVHKLFEFMRADAMFTLDQVFGTTAFFTRTHAPTFDPFGDSWWKQNYNAHPLLRYTWQEKGRNSLPASLRRSLRRLKSFSSGADRQCSPKILSPVEAATVADTGEVDIDVVVPAGAHLWVLVKRADLDRWWPQGNGAVQIASNRWQASVTYGGPQDAGFAFEIAAIVAGPSTHELWLAWARRAQQTGLFPPVPLPRPSYVRGEAYRTVTKRMSA